MSTSFSLGKKKDNFGEIDFSKLRSGITKSELGIEEGSVLDSIWKSIDTNHEGNSKDKLDRQELQAFIEKIRILCGKDTNLSTGEAKKFQLDEENKLGGKNKKELLSFLQKLSKLTEGVDRVETSEESDVEVIVYSDGHIEELSPDGSKVIKSKDGTKITKLDSKGFVTEETVVEDGVTTKTEYETESECIKKQVITDEENHTDTVILYAQGKPITKKVTNSANNEIQEFVYQDDEPVLKKITNTQTGEVTEYNGEEVTRTIERDGVKTVTVSVADMPTRKTVTTQTEEGKRVSDIVYNGDDLVENVTVDGIQRYQRKLISDTEYEVNYDAEGNTIGIIVQVDESIRSIAKKFGVTPEALVKANASVLKGRKFFRAGDEIRIPKRLEADDPALQGRKSREEVLAIVEQRRLAATRRREEAARREAERQARVGDVIVTGRNGYYVTKTTDGNLHYWNPQKKEITAEAFKEVCPTIYKDVTEAQRGATRRTRKKFDTGSIKSGATQLAKKIHGQISGASGNTNTINLLRGITPENAAFVVSEYQRLYNVSLAKDIDDEWGLDLNTVKEHVCKKLVQQAKTLGLKGIYYGDYEKCNDIASLQRWINNASSKIMNYMSGATETYYATEAEETQRRQSVANTRVAKTSAEQIVNDLIDAQSGYNDVGKIKAAIARIDRPEELKEVNRLLTLKGYPPTDKYSPIEHFIYDESDHSVSHTYNSSDYLEQTVQNWINKGVLTGQDANEAQARMAARVLFDGGDGFGTDCNKIKKAVRMIKCPRPTGNREADNRQAREVYRLVNKMINDHNTFYGLGSSCTDLVDYCDGEMWDGEVKYLKGILAETNAIHGAEKAEAITDLTQEAVEGAGTDIEYLEQAIRGIDSPADRAAVEAKLKEYCKRKGINPQIQGQAFLQAILYDECDNFMGIGRDHKEIRGFNEMLIQQGAYTPDEVINIRAEQAALQILEGNYANVKDAVEQIKAPDVLTKVNQLLKTKTGKTLDEYIADKLSPTNADLVRAELASNNLLENDKAAEVAYRLLKNSDFNNRAMGFKAIRNEAIANLVDAKLKKDGSSLAQVLKKFNEEKADYIKKAEFWDGLGKFLPVVGVFAEDISDAYRANTDSSDNMYVEAQNAQQLSPEQQARYRQTVQLMEEKLKKMEDDYEAALRSQGSVSAAVNRFCEIYCIGTTQEDIDKRIEHDKETVRLLKLAAEGKLAKNVNGRTVPVSFEEVFKERNYGSAYDAVVEETVMVDGKPTVVKVSRIEKVEQQAEMLVAMDYAKENIAVCWEELENGLQTKDAARLTVAIIDTLEKLSAMTGRELSLAGYGYSLKNNVIVDSNGKQVPTGKLIELANKLKQGLSDISRDLLGQAIPLNTSASNINDVLEDAYDKKKESFKEEFKAAFGQDCPDSMIDSYISTIETGKTVLNIGIMIGAVVAAPFTGGGSLAVFALSATASLALNGLENSTDADGWTNSEWTADLTQAMWDGALAAAGFKVGQYAEAFAKGGSAAIQSNKWLSALPKNEATRVLRQAKVIAAQLEKQSAKIGKSVLEAHKAKLHNLFPNLNVTTVEKLSVIVARVEAAGFEITSDTMQSLVQMYCQNGGFDEESFMRDMIISLAANAGGHAWGARGDIKDMHVDESSGNFSPSAERGARDAVEDGEVARGADQSHLNANERGEVDDGLEDVPTREDLDNYDRENGYQEPTPDQRADIDANNADAAAAQAESSQIGNNLDAASAGALNGLRGQLTDVNPDLNGVFKNDQAEFVVKEGKVTEIRTNDGRIITDEKKIAKYMSKNEVHVEDLAPVKPDEVLPESSVDVEPVTPHSLPPAEVPELPKTYAEMDANELFTEYQRLRTEMLDSRGRINNKSALLEIQNLLESRGFRIENNNLVQANIAPSSVRSGSEPPRNVSYTGRDLTQYRARRSDYGSVDHATFHEQNPDLFKGTHDYGFWAGKESSDPHHGAWKMHLFSIDEADWQELSDVIIPYLRDHDIDWKTFNAGHTPEMLTGKQSGKAFTIYPRDKEHFEQIARDLDFIIRNNKLNRAGSAITGDRALGDTGRLFYRYEFNSGTHADEVLDLSRGSSDWATYDSYYDSNRGADAPFGGYLARDMVPSDDPWRNFNPADPTSAPSTKLERGRAYPLDDASSLQLSSVTVDLNNPAIRAKLNNIPEGGSITIGREGTIPINQNYSDVSRVHVEIVKRDGKLYVIDHSSNGTSISYAKAPDVDAAPRRLSPSELRARLGEQLHNVYNNIVENGINKIKTLVDFHNVVANIREHFSEFNDVMMDLLHQAKEKAKSLGLRVKESLAELAAPRRSNVSSYQGVFRPDADIACPPYTPVMVAPDSKIRLANHVDIDLQDFQSRFDLMQDGDSFLIGRTVSGPNDICINNEYVSGQHLKIEKIDGKIYVTDLSSSNGTVINTTKPDYAAQWHPQTSGRYANATSDDFYRIADQYYDDLRLANYSYESSVNPNIRQSDVMPEEGIMRTENITGFGMRGWFWRKPRRLQGEPNIVDRISLNVKADKKMLEELDRLMQTGEYVNKQGRTVKLDVPEGYYKTPQTLEDWGSRHDPITMYFSETISQDLQNAIADITEKYARTPSNGKALMNSLEGKPWIAHEAYTSVETAKGLYEEARRLNPELAKAMYYQLGGNEGWNCSTGMYAAAKRMVDEYKMSIVNAGDVNSFHRNINLSEPEVIPDVIEIRPDVSPIQQSQNFNSTHNIPCDEVVVDGYRDGGRGAQFMDDGSVYSSREIIVVDRTRDVALQRMIQDVKTKTAGMNPKQKAAFLQDYIARKCGDGGNAYRNLGAFVNNNKSQEVLLGDIIEMQPPVAVCRHRSLLLKVLGDELGLHVELQRGNFYEGGQPIYDLQGNLMNHGGGHAWNVIKFEDGTSAIYDAMHNRTSNITAGSVDSYAKNYTAVNDAKLYDYGIEPYGQQYLGDVAYIDILEEIDDVDSVVQPSFIDTENITADFAPNYTRVAIDRNTSTRYEFRSVDDHKKIMNLSGKNKAFVDLLAQRCITLNGRKQARFTADQIEQLISITGGNPKVIQRYLNALDNNLPADAFIARINADRAVLQQHFSSTTSYSADEVNRLTNLAMDFDSDLVKMLVYAKLPSTGAVRFTVDDIEMLVKLSNGNKNLVTSYLGELPFNNGTKGLANARQLKSVLAVANFNMKNLKYTPDELGRLTQLALNTDAGIVQKLTRFVFTNNGQSVHALSIDDIESILKSFNGNLSVLEKVLDYKFLFKGQPTSLSSDNIKKFTELYKQNPVLFEEALSVSQRFGGKYSPAEIERICNADVSNVVLFRQMLNQGFYDVESLVSLPNMSTEGVAAYNAIMRSNNVPNMKGRGITKPYTDDTFQYVVYAPNSKNIVEFEIKDGIPVEVAREQVTITTKGYTRSSRTYPDGTRLVSEVQYAADGRTIVSQRKTYYDDEGNISHSEVMKPSDKNPNLFTVYEWQRGTGQPGRRVGTVELYGKGDNSATKLARTYEAPDGIKTNVTIIEGPKGGGADIAISGADGEVLYTQKRRFRKLSETEFRSTLDDTTYDMKFSDDKIEITVTEANGQKRVVELGPDLLDPSLMSLYKQLPGDALVAIKDMNLKISLGGKAVANNACFTPSDNAIYISKELKDNPFVFLHELGHAKDSVMLNGLRNDPELNRIFAEEKELYKSMTSDLEGHSIDYFTTNNHYSGNSLSEVIAETNALMSGRHNNGFDIIQMRSVVLQKYFPKTLAYIANKLK